MFDALKKLLGGKSSSPVTSPPQDARELRRTVATCPDCGVRAGELHDLFCLQERCPFCKGQLACCECIHRELKLLDSEQLLVDEYVDDSKPPLSDIMRRWREALDRKGRIPFAPFAESPWHTAGKGEAAAMRDFLDRGFAPDTMNEQGYTTLMSAARGSCLEVMQLLLARGANVNLADKAGYTALHCAVWAEHPDAELQLACVRALTDAGADLHARSGTGITPLMNAAWFGCTGAVKFLLAQGADPHARDEKGRTARDLALERKHPAVAELLK